VAVSDDQDDLGETDPVRERVMARAAAALALADEALARPRPYAGAGDAWAAGMALSKGQGDNVTLPPAASPSPAPRVLTRRDDSALAKAIGRVIAQEQRDRDAAIKKAILTVVDQTGKVIGQTQAEIEKQANEKFAAMEARLLLLETRLASAESRLAQAENTKGKRK
jgi:hypothetical protein